MNIMITIPMEIVFLLEGIAHFQTQPYGLTMMNYLSIKAIGFLQCFYTTVLNYQIHKYDMINNDIDPSRS